jgi:hypothetical protein
LRGQARIGVDYLRDGLIQFLPGNVPLIHEGYVAAVQPLMERAVCVGPRSQP